MAEGQAEFLGTGERHLDQSEHLVPIHDWNRPPRIVWPLEAGEAALLESVCPVVDGSRRAADTIRHLCRAATSGELSDNPVTLVDARRQRPVGHFGLQSLVLAAEQGSKLD